MAQEDNELSVTLPEELRLQFAGVQRRLWRVETAAASSAIIAGLILSLLALFVSDRLWNTPPGLRLFFLLAGLFIVAAACCWWARRWVWEPRSQLDLARRVQKRYRRLGDRLLGIVELAQEQGRQANFSPALYHAAIQQVAKEARDYDFLESVSAKPAKKYGLGAAVAVVLLLACALLFPQASWNAFRRWLAPIANVPRYTLVDLEGLPRELIVPRGEPFTIVGNVRYRSFWHPGGVSAELLTSPKLTGAVDSGKIRLQIPGQVENGILKVRLGDAVAEVKVTPVNHPSLREMSAHIQFPGYLQYPDRDEALQSGSMAAVEGSRISFQGKTSRALRSANMQRQGDDAVPLQIEGDRFSSAPVQPEGITEYAFNWCDNLGLSNAGGSRLSVVMQKDAPPTADLPALSRETAVLVSDVLHIRVDANDDFGVRDLGLTWNVVSDTPLNEIITSEVKVMPNAPNVKKAAKVFLWSPESFRIPADCTVELQGYARDFFPERERSRTAPYRIHVLSPEEHAELVREKLEDVMSRIEDVTRLQEKIVANLHETKDNEKLPASQKSERLGASKQDQLENSSHLQELSEQAQSAIQEAMKNPVFPAETIRQWSQSAQQWQKLAQEKMQQAAKAMQSAQQGGQSSQQQMDDATQKAEDVLSALEKNQQKAGRNLDELHALTLAERLHKIGNQEKDISGQLLKNAPDIIGLPPADLPDKLKLFEHALTTDQSQAQTETESLQGEISRFFERTQKTNYGAVSRDMKESHASDALDKLGGMITDNVSIEASGDLTQWSERFRKWGDDLQPKPESSGGQGSGGKSQGKDLTEQLIALLRLRESEMNLRDQTTVLDQQKGEPAKYKERATGLSSSQTKMEDSLETIRRKTDLNALESAFKQTATAMQKVESILQTPQTGKPADDAEVKTIDSLSDLVNLINEQAQQGSSKSSAGSSQNPEEMAFLLRMMQNTANAKAMALQPSGGPNSAGGKTDRAGHPVSGNVNGKSAAARNVSKATGVSENSPAEFRDALDNYFHGIEQTKD